MSRISAVVSAFALLGVLASHPAGAAQRVFVASYGNDANTATGCVFANPCRGFTAAMTVVDPGGEVVALDAAGYGAVTITKSVTITANPGYFAGIAASSGNAVTIATASVKVILRGLNINGIGGTNGVFMSDGASLSVENCVISAFDTGVRVQTAAVVRIIDTLIRDNTGGIALSSASTGIISGSKVLDSIGIGVLVSGDIAGETTSAAITDTLVTGGNTGVFASGANATGTARISLNRSTLANSSYGAVLNSVQGTAVISIGNSLVTRNFVSGLYQGGIGTTLESLGNNNVRQNGSDTTGTITTVPTI